MPDLDALSEMDQFSPAATRPERRLFSNSVAMGVANIASRGLAYVYFILMARRLDARYIGVYALLVAAAMLVELVANLGLDKTLIREIASSPAAEGQGYFWSALPIRLITAFLSSSVAWLLLLHFFNDLSLASPLRSAIFLSAIFPIVLAHNCESFLTAHETLIPIAISQLSERVVILCAVLLLFSSLISFSGFLCVAPLASFVRLTIVAVATMRRWTFHLPARQPALRHVLGQAGQLFSVEILAQAYFRSDVFVLAKLGGLPATGIYQITYKIFDCCLSLFTGFLQAAFPRLVRDKSGRSLQSMLIWGTCLLAILSALIILFRHFILGTIKPDYIQGSTALVWLMLTVPLVYITSTLANAAIAASQINVLIILAAFLLVSNITLNVILIPRWSLNGAAFSTFACELLSAIILGARYTIAPKVA
jgi:O-antigen/teichoic acid export membrane protein